MVMMELGLVMELISISKVKNYLNRKLIYGVKKIERLRAKKKKARSRLLFQTYAQ